MTSLQIPGIATITPAWLTSCLQAAGFAGARVERIRAERIGTGKAAACARLSVDYAAAPEGVPLTLIAKYPSDDALSRTSCAAMGIYRREVEFYRDIAPRLSMTLPHCFFLGVDSAGEQFLILMEDLAPRVTVVDWQGMRTGRPLNDVALCLAGSLEPGARREVEHSIVEDYHGALVRAGVQDFSFDQRWFEYRRAAFAGFGLTVISAMTVVQTPRGDQMFAAMARRYAQHALDLGADEFLAD